MQSDNHLTPSEVSLSYKSKPTLIKKAAFKPNNPKLAWRKMDEED